MFSFSSGYEKKKENQITTIQTSETMYKTIVVLLQLFNLKLIDTFDFRMYKLTTFLTYKNHTKYLVQKHMYNI